jgi:hypothetical protein
MNLNCDAPSVKRVVYLSGVTGYDKNYLARRSGVKD